MPRWFPAVELTERMANEEDKCLQRNDVLVDLVNATSSALLGLTMQCAQCHNHKFDPVTIPDYLRLQGFG